jgi:hypothetical protein
MCSNIHGRLNDLVKGINLLTSTTSGWGSSICPIALFCEHVYVHVWARGYNQGEAFTIHIIRDKKMGSSKLPRWTIAAHDPWNLPRKQTPYMHVRSCFPTFQHTHPHLSTMYAQKVTHKQSPTSPNEFFMLMKVHEHLIGRAIKSRLLLSAWKKKQFNTARINGLCSPRS